MNKPTTTQIAKCFARALLALLMIGVATTQAAVIVNETFNLYDSTTGGSAPLEANWNLLGSSPNAINWAGTGGLNDSGTMNMASGTGDYSAISKAAFSIAALQAGDTIRTSVFFKDELNGASAGPTFGFRSTNNEQMTTNSYIAVGLRNNNLQFRVLNNGTQVVLSTNAAPISPGNWYYLQLDVVKTATSGTFDVTAAIYNASSTGTVGSVLNVGAEVMSYSVTGVVNATLYGDTEVFAGMRNGSDLSGLSMAGIIDDFKLETNPIIPEPSTSVLMASGLVLALCIGRARK